MSGESIEVLHLVAVERESAGTYACSALNTEGETRSSHLSLRVQCKWGIEFYSRVSFFGAVLNFGSGIGR